MDLKEPNFYDVFGVRRVREFCPPHFETTTLPQRYNLEQSITKWIEYNCKGRFYSGKGVILNNENKVVTVLKIGFENPKELSYFMLACPHLKYS